MQGEDASREFPSVTDFYGDDFDRHCLSLQLMSLAARLDSQTQLHLQDIVTYLWGFTSAEHVIFSEVVTLLKIILVEALLCPCIAHHVSHAGSLLFAIWTVLSVCTCVSIILSHYRRLLVCT
jgi:hypothetical protein